ncbi:MAG TPA: hypothetical protein VF334_11500, partial [Polyangia bacterium]
FVAATAAPAIAACRMRAARDACCCAPPPANALCAPDCCDRAQPCRSLVDLTTHLRGLALLAAPLFWSLPRLDATPAGAAPAARALVGLHERAAPRLPLRI